MHAMPMGLPGPAEISSGAGGHQNVRNVIFLGQRMIMMMQQAKCASCNCAWTPHGTARTISLCKSKLFISRSCPILVLTTILGRTRRAYVKKSVKNYQGPKKAFLSRF